MNDTRMASSAFTLVSYTEDDTRYFTNDGDGIRSNLWQGASVKPFPQFTETLGRGAVIGIAAALGFALLAMLPFLLDFAPPDSNTSWQEGLSTYSFVGVAALIIAAIVGLVGGAAMALLIWLFFRYLPSAMTRHSFACGFLLCLLPALTFPLSESLYQVSSTRGAGGGPILFNTRFFALLMLPVLVAAIASGWFARRYFAPPSAHGDGEKSFIQ